MNKELHDKKKSICILRSMEGLKAIRLLGEDGITCEKLPLPPGSIAEQNQLLSSWQRLAESNLEDPDLVYDILFILKHTFPEKPLSIPLKNLESHILSPEPPKATAANPRGFKGTKRQLPKVSPTEQIDLRPYLLNFQGTRQLIGLFKDLRKKFPENKDPFLVSDFDCPDKANFFALPIGFRTFFLPQLKGESWSQVNDMLKVYFELGLDENKDLQLLCLKCLSLLGTKKTCELLFQLPRVEFEIRSNVLELIINRLSNYPEIAKSLPENLIEFALNYSDCAELVEVLHFIFSGLRDGSNLELITFGLDLYRQFGESLHFSNRYNLATLWLFEFDGTVNNLPVADIKIFLKNMVGKESHFNRWNEKVYWLFGLKIADGCAASAEFEKLFKEIRWTKYHPSIAHHYCTRLIDTPQFCKMHKNFDQYLLRHGNDSQSHSLLFEISDITIEEDEDVSHLDDFIPWFIKISEIESVSKGHICNLLHIIFKYASIEKRLSMLKLADSNIIEFAEECTGLNDVRLLEIGLTTIAKSCPDLLVDSLHTCCRSLMKTARSLGCLNSSLRKEILHDFVNHPVFRIEVKTEQQKIQALKLLLDYPGLFSISRRLKEKLINNEAVADEILDRTITALTSSLNRMKIQLLFELINSNLLPNRPTAELSSSIKHALKLLQYKTNEKNARAFKKFVYHYLDGEKDYLINHPRTQEWLSKRKHLNLEAWTAGFQKKYHVGVNKTPYKLKIELDPFEELKHGTHVGSCTGLGGNFSDSAMGTVLDVNKKVVYALNEKNAVVARQLLAISKDDKLVCYSVYPGAVKGFMKKLFNQFNLDLAEEMKIEIQPESADYKVECIISSSWFDDGNYFGQGKKRA